MRFVSFVSLSTLFLAVAASALPVDSDDTAVISPVCQEGDLYCAEEQNATRYTTLFASDDGEDLVAAVGAVDEEEEDADDTVNENTLERNGGSCFPSVDFTPPSSTTPGVSVNKWWCNRTSEYAFLGFSYSISKCPSKAKLLADFKQMKRQYRARYVRIYGGCNASSNYYNRIVDAAYEAGVGVYALVWFGFNGPSDRSWERQLNGLTNVMKTNRRAPYVIRDIAIGSEPLFDNAISSKNLATKITQTKGTFKRPTSLHVTTSEMAYKLAQNRNVVNASDSIQLNVLPFFSSFATTGNSAQARNQVVRDLDQMRGVSGGGKKIYMTQTGWPSSKEVWQPNSVHAQATRASEQKYFEMLDGMCPTFKKYPQGGVGWFAHIWEDNELPGWGIVKNGQPKIAFKPRTRC